MQLYTIGHSNHPLDKFLSLLETHAIQTVVDVRTMPYSRWHPQYIGSRLQSALAEASISYIYAGKELGGRPSDPSCYKSGKLPGKDADFINEVSYPAVMKKDWFQFGIHSLLETAARTRTAILCSEEDPQRCHRHHLIAAYIQQIDPTVEICHIRNLSSPRVQERLKK